MSVCMCVVCVCMCGIWRSVDNLRDPFSLSTTQVLGMKIQVTSLHLASPTLRFLVVQGNRRICLKAKWGKLGCCVLGGGTERRAFSTVDSDPSTVSVSAASRELRSFYTECTSNCASGLPFLQRVLSTLPSPESFCFTKFSFFFSHICTVFDIKRLHGVS